MIVNTGASGDDEDVGGDLEVAWRRFDERLVSASSSAERCVTALRRLSRSRKAARLRGDRARLANEEARRRLRSLAERMRGIVPLSEVGESGEDGDGER